MNLRIALILLAATATFACDAGTEAGPFSPTQPDGVESAKADTLHRDIEALPADESLRSSFLREKICNVAGSAHERGVMEGSCDDQAFTITAFYGNKTVIKDGEPLLVAMDVTFESDMGFVVATKLVRQVDPLSHGFFWQAKYLGVLDAPEVDPLEEEFFTIVKESGTSPDSFNDWSDRFEDVAFTDLPDPVHSFALDEINAYADEHPDEFVESTASWRITTEDGQTTLGWAVQIEATIENGELGWVYYFDAEGAFVDVFDWTT